MDKTNPAEWQAVKPKSIVTISDAQGIQDSMRRGLGVRGLDYTVRSVALCEQLDCLSTHLIFTLDDAEQAAFLLVKIVDDLVDLTLYFEPPGLSGGERTDLLDRGMQWLFQTPANLHSFEPSELRYTTSLVQTVPGAAGAPPLELLYTLKPQGELQCHYSESPARAGLAAQMLATLVEYRCDQPAENPEFLILEVGEERSRRSFLRFFLGCPIGLSEVDVLGI
jgi:hypothetical protein